MAVDLRRSSHTRGRWVGVRISDLNRRQLWIPPGFGHAFLVLSEEVDFLYKTTAYYSLEDEYCVRWDDETLGIDWPLEGAPVVSRRDAEGLSFANAPPFE